MQKTIHKHSTIQLFNPKYILTWVLFFIAWILGQLSHKTALRIGNCIGAVIYKLFPKRVYIVKTNMQLCFPEKSDSEINILVKQHFKDLVSGVCETAIAWYGSNKAIDMLSNKIEFENEHILQQYLNSDKPLLMLTPHSVSQEFLSKYLARKYKYTPVFRHMNNPVANYLMQKARLRIYKNLILKADTRTIVKSLRSHKEPVAILPDQDFGRKRSVFVPFFGVPAATTTALSKYKKMTDCNIIVLSYSRKFDSKSDKLSGIPSKYVIKVFPPLEITGYDFEHDAREFNKVLEQIILKDITTYFWVARKFKTRPIGEPKIYKYKSKNLFRKLQNLISNKA